AGVCVARLEVVVGLLALVGLATRWVAAVGLALNLLLFLTASWRTSPYFLGPDIVFVFAWLPFVFVGSLGQPALEHVVARAAERRTHSRHGRARGDPVSTRRAGRLAHRAQRDLHARRVQRELPVGRALLP